MDISTVKSYGANPMGSPIGRRLAGFAKEFSFRTGSFLEVKERRHGQMAFPVTQEVGTTFVVL